MRAAAVDALVVSHLPNIRYLTGFVGTAGLVVLTPETCLLIVDFRYQTVARSLVAIESRPRATTSPSSCRRGATTRRSPMSCARAAHGESASRPRRCRSAGSTVCRRRLRARHRRRFGALTAVRRLFRRSESSRASGWSKDEAEIATLKEAGRRLGCATAEAASLAAAGRDPRSRSLRDLDALLRRSGFERPAFETIVASGPNSALPHARPGRRVLSERGWGGAGLWRGLRRILRGSYADG